MKRAAEWFLTMREIPLERACDFINAPPPEPENENEDEAETEELSSSSLYDTALDPTEGLWLRTGWAGRG